MKNLKNTSLRSDGYEEGAWTRSNFNPGSCWRSSHLPSLHQFFSILWNFTVRIPSVGQDNFFTRLCHSAHGQGSAFSQCHAQAEAPHKADPIRRKTPPPTRSTGGRYVSYWNACFFRNMYGWYPAANPGCNAVIVRCHHRCASDRRKVVIRSNPINMMKN